jgi:hypothetical protein
MSPIDDLVVQRRALQEVPQIVAENQPTNPTTQSHQCRMGQPPVPRLHLHEAGEMLS